LSGNSTSVFSALASQVKADSIVCNDSNMLEDVRSLALLRYKYVPKNFIFYKMIEGQNVKGVAIGATLKGKYAINVSYQINNDYSIDILYVIDYEPGSLESLFAPFLGVEE